MSDNEPMTKPARDVLGSIMKTKSVPLLALLVKACMHRRDVLLGYEVDGLDVERQLAQLDGPSRKRATSLLAAVAKLKERRDVSALCRFAIEHRKVLRAAK